MGGASCSVSARLLPTGARPDLSWHSRKQGGIQRLSRLEAQTGGSRSHPQAIITGVRALLPLY